MASFWKLHHEADRETSWTAASVKYSQQVTGKILCKSSWSHWLQYHCSNTCILRILALSWVREDSGVRFSSPQLAQTSLSCESFFVCHMMTSICYHNKKSLHRHMEVLEVSDGALYGRACRLPINVINVRPSSGVLFCFTQFRGSFGVTLFKHFRLKDCHFILSRSSYLAILIVSRCVVFWIPTMISMLFVHSWKDYTSQRGQAFIKSCTGHLAFNAQVAGIGFFLFSALSMASAWQSLQ